MRKEGAPQHEEGYSHEESLAEEKRKKFVSDFFEGSVEQLLAESMQTRRKNERLEASLAEAQKLAEHDSLMEILNRRGFEKIIKDIQAKGIKGTLMLVDIDNFKEINTYFGHLTGDAVLKAAADYLRGISRPADLICRLGGEEIVVFYPGATVEEVFQKFKQEGTDKAVMGFEFDFKNPKLRSNHVTFSGGITELEPSESLREALGRADHAMYDAKDEGKNHIKIAEDIMAGSHK